MNDHPPVVVHRAGIGLLTIYTIGILTFALATLVLELLYVRYGFTVYQIVTLLVLASLLDLSIVYLSVYVYTRSVLIFTPQQLTIIRQVGIFRQQKVEFSISQLQDVKVLRPGLLSNVFDYGTLEVQVANDSGTLELPTVPDPDHWAAYLLTARQTASSALNQ